MKQDNIILVGMPGCGKSTIGAALSKISGFSFLDLDLLIEEKQNMSITEIFKSKGEIFFRKLETDTIKELFKIDFPFVLSTGGGSVENIENMQLLKKLGKVFYLEILPDEIFDRIKGDTTRPLLQKDNPKEVLFEIYSRRKEKYETADFKIDASKAVKEIVDEIYEKVKS